MTRTAFLSSVAAVIFLIGASGAGQSRSSAPLLRHDTGFRIVEASLADIRAALADGRLTSHELVTQYLVRMATYEDRLRAALFVNPHALEEADQLDRERAQGRLRGPLHGIPVALKDNIHTTSMPTTGGALAFAGYTPPYDATLTNNLRDAGAIIIAKTGLTELANWVAGAPTPMPGNYTAVAGFAGKKWPLIRGDCAPGAPTRNPFRVTQTGS